MLRSPTTEGNASESLSHLALCYVSSVEERFVRVGPYGFLIPGFWAECRTGSNAQRHKLHSIAVTSMTFDVLIDEGSGSDEAVQAYFEQLTPLFAPESVAEANFELDGAEFLARRMENPRGVSNEDGTLAELYAGVLGKDLLTFNIIRGPACVEQETSEKLRALCLHMVHAAVLRRMNEFPELFA